MAAASAQLSEDSLLCSICLSVFTKPVTIPCGHNFCMDCITACWSTISTVLQCPLCKENYYSRPLLRVNPVIAEMAEKVNKDEQRGNGDVLCGMCTGAKVRALKSCLVCFMSYCQTHLGPHQRIPALKKHKLIDPVNDLESRICKHHYKPLELFCRVEQTFLCESCKGGEHQTHEIVTLEDEAERRKTQLGLEKKSMDQMVQEHQQKIQEVQHSVKSSREKAEEALSCSRRVMTALIEHINTEFTGLTEAIKTKQKNNEIKAENLIHDLEGEISHMKQKKLQLHEASRSRDPFRFLENILSVTSNQPHVKNWSDVTVSSDQFRIQEALAELETTVREKVSRLSELSFREEKQQRLQEKADLEYEHKRERKQSLTKMLTFYTKKVAKRRTSFCNNSHIIAIEFGSTYSGYAFSLTPRGVQIDSQLRKWGKELGLDTPKTPTCILFNEHEEFLRFGYEAKTAYTNMRVKEAQKHYFFENFKMALCDKKLRRDVMIEAANRKSMKALKVFTEALRYLKEDSLKTIADYTVGRTFTASDFTWVLPVPVNWDPSVKQFMREAATQAGMVTEGCENQLIITLDPEAASVWCMKLPADGFITQNHDGEALDRSPGTQYMVVDCGGENINITVHEVLDGGALKMLHKISGNDLGGQSVDRKFKEFLREIFCDGVWDEYEENFPSEVQKIMTDFMYFKQVDDDVQISCPFNLGTLAQKRQEIEKFFESVRGASWDDGAIIISKETLRSFFADSLKGITDSLREILKKNLNIEYMLLVGGYAESKILRQHVIDQFGDQCKVLCPFRPQEAVMKGAVMLGRNPGLVASRNSAFTYGFADSERFDEYKHKKGKKFAADGVEFCCDIFRKMVEEGEDVGWNETRTHILYPLNEDQRAVKIKLYRTQRKSRMYVDEWGVEEVGSFLVNMSDTTGGENHKVELEFMFGSTEIRVTGTDLESGSKRSLEIDFMTKA